VTLLAAFEVLVSSLSDTESFVVGIPMASQPLRENVRLVAHGVNTIPLKCSVSPKQSFIDHLRSVRQAFLDAQAHQRLTFGSLIRALKLPRDPSRTTLISVIFNIDRIGSPFDFGELKIERIETPKAFCNFELSINAIDDGECLLLECDYNVDLFDAETIQRWLDAYETMLRSAIRGDALTSQLDFSPSDAERPLRSLHPMRTIVAPRTATESMVVEVFASVLNRSDVGALDDFFDLGGHSLMAARVMAKLRAAAGVDLALRNLFERSTPEALAAAIDAMSWTAASRENNRNSSDREEVDL
jgi:non-ribosomal peptide synthetase component F